MSVNPLSIKAGTAELNHELEDWNLLEPAEGGASRVFEHRVTFEAPFHQVPVVHAGLSGLDVDNGDNARIRLEIRDIDAAGFTLRLHSWLGTRIWSVAVAWLALG